MNEPTLEELNARQAQWDSMVDAAQDIVKRIVESGGMANKSRVEDELMPMFDMDRYTAHQIMNHIERHNLRKWGR